MQSYIRMLRKRVRASRYAVDERAVAEAMLARTRPRRSADRADARKRLAWLEKQIKQFRFDNRGSAETAAAPARSVRRATARRGRSRRATARSQGDTTARIIAFLTRHPQSTAGDLAKSLNLDPESASTRLSQLTKAGEIKKQAHGYSTQQSTPLRRSRRSRP
jgi:predicted HTH transcriptional regulator